MKTVKATPEQLKDIERRMWDWEEWHFLKEKAYDEWAANLTRERAEEILNDFTKEEWELGDDDDPQVADSLWQEIGFC